MESSDSSATDEDAAQQSEQPKILTAKVCYVDCKPQFLGLISMSYGMASQQYCCTFSVCNDANLHDQSQILTLQTNLGGRFQTICV